MMAKGLFVPSPQVDEELAPEHTLSKSLSTLRSGTFPLWMKEVGCGHSLWQNLFITTLNSAV